MLFLYFFHLSSVGLILAVCFSTLNLSCLFLSHCCSSTPSPSSFSPPILLCAPISLQIHLDSFCLAVAFLHSLPLPLLLQSLSFSLSPSKSILSPSLSLLLFYRLSPSPSPPIPLCLPPSPPHPRSVCDVPPSGEAEECLGAAVLGRAGPQGPRERRRAAGEDEEAPEGAGAGAQEDPEPGGAAVLFLPHLLLLATPLR